MKNFKSIKNKILFSSLVLIISSMLILGTCVVFILYKNSQQILEETLTEAAKIAAERVGQEIIAYQNVARELGCISELADANVSVAVKKEILDEKVSTYNLVEGNVIGADGINLFNGVQCGEREYFKAAMNGEIYISRPDISQVTGKLTMFISAPLWKDGKTNSTVVGIIMLIPQEDFLDNIVQSIKVSDNGGAYILDAEGTAVAHTTAGLVANANNSIALSQNDSSLKAIAVLERKMIAGELGFGRYTYNGVNKFLAYAPIQNINSWSLGINAPVSDFLGSTILGIVITIVIIFVAILAALIILRNIADKISRPIKLCSDRLDLLSKGDLHTPTVEINSADETGVLAAATKGIVSITSKIIKDVAYLLEEMSNGNFDIHSTELDSYIGDYQTILTSMRLLKSSLSSTLRGIEESASQVSAGAEQMAVAAQALAEGASDQAGSVEELLATVNEITDQAKVSAVEALSTHKEAQLIGEQAKEGSTQVEGMTTAMQRISEASNEIAKVITSIQDIASQTNLLSLNAAIEAARAGESGKGFAVVADEIRKLSIQSAEAVEDTRELINTALNEVSNGSALVDNTSASLNMIIVDIENVVASIESVSSAFEMQAESIAQINIGVEQISNVVQNNSATAQESSATSEELSAQATTLNQMVDEFKLASD